ncbi:MAG: hypothetical protein PHH84_03040 [Oscillospiraceae bacterium]|nr:hypothetical protein [Oscillospiraceae bacterium]MDD4413647.1 hypothetical protein [Oscillospiraceae bacterium]
MSEFNETVKYLPTSLKSRVMMLPESLTDRIQEIRLRSDAPLTLSTPDGEWMVASSGKAVKSGGDYIICMPADIDECFLMLCEYSVHTHQNELKTGFITSPNGSRAGVAGTAVVDNGRVVSYRNITSICLRVARRHIGCATKMIDTLIDGGRICGTLICGEPSSGKSSLLRDTARQLTSGMAERRWRVSVVDERGELSGDGSLKSCDVLRYSPKAVGIQQAVRCLAPDVVIFDELGSIEETKAVLDGLNSGVAAITSAHCNNGRSLFSRPLLVTALKSGAFERVVFLEGRGSPGTISRIMNVGDMFAENSRTDTGYNGGDGYRYSFLSVSEPAHSIT